MRQPKKAPTRRRAALKRTAIALALLALVLALDGARLTPAGTIKDAAERCATGPVEQVMDLGRVPIGKRARKAYLSANEDALLFSVANFYPLNGGWGDGATATVDLARTGGPVKAGRWSASLWGRDLPENTPGDRVNYFFGRVDSPDIREIEVRYMERLDEDTLEQAGESVRSARRDWVSREGRTYFVFRGEVEPENGSESGYYGEYWITARDASGAIVAETEIGQWTVTSVSD